MLPWWGWLLVVMGINVFASIIYVYRSRDSIPRLAATGLGGKP